MGRDLRNFRGNKNFKTKQTNTQKTENKQTNKQKTKQKKNKTKTKTTRTTKKKNITSNQPVLREKNPQIGQRFQTWAAHSVEKLFLVPPPPGDDSSDCHI